MIVTDYLAQKTSVRDDVILFCFTNTRSSEATRGDSQNNRDVTDSGWKHVCFPSKEDIQTSLYLASYLFGI